MQTALVNCPQARSNCLRQPLLEHLGLGYVAASLREAGFAVRIVDADVEGIDQQDVVRRISECRPKLIGCTVSHFNLHSSIALIQSLRRQQYRGHIVLGGYLPTFLWKEFFRDFDGFDTIVRGEGERTIVQLAECVRSGVSCKGVLGTVCKDGDRVIVNPPRPVISELDGIPFPARDTLHDLFDRGNPVASISASRGCYMNCSFCSIVAFYGLAEARRWRGRSPQKVVDEVESLVNSQPFEEYNGDYIWFCVDEFVGPVVSGRTHAQGIAEEILQRGLHVRFEADCRADQVDVPLFALLKKAGLRRVYLGVESFVQTDLDGYRKGASVRKNMQALAILDGLRIDYSIGIIMFSPWTTFAEFCENHRVMSGLGYHKLTSGLTRLKVFRGTALEQQLLRTRDPKISYGGAIRDLKRPGALDYVYDYGFQDDRVAALWAILGDLENENERIVSRLAELRLDNAIDGVLFWYLVYLARDSLSCFVAEAISSVREGRDSDRQIERLRRRQRSRIAQSLTQVEKLRNRNTSAISQEVQAIRINGLQVCCPTSESRFICSPGYERDYVAFSYESLCKEFLVPDVKVLEFAVQETWFHGVNNDRRKHHQVDRQKEESQQHCPLKTKGI